MMWLLAILCNAISRRWCGLSEHDQHRRDQGRYDETLLRRQRACVPVPAQRRASSW